MHGYRSLEGTFLGGCLFSGRTAGRAARGRAVSGRAGSDPVGRDAGPPQTAPPTPDARPYPGRPSAAGSAAGYRGRRAYGGRRPAAPTAGRGRTATPGRGARRRRRARAGRARSSPPRCSRSCRRRWCCWPPCTCFLLVDRVARRGGAGGPATCPASTGWPPRGRSLALVQLLSVVRARRGRACWRWPAGRGGPLAGAARRARRAGRPRRLLGGAAVGSLDDLPGRRPGRRRSPGSRCSSPRCRSSGWAGAGRRRAAVVRRGRGGPGLTADRPGRRRRGESAHAHARRRSRRRSDLDPGSPRCCAATPPGWSPPSSSSTTPARCSCSPGWTTRRCTAR